VAIIARGFASTFHLDDFRPDFTFQENIIMSKFALLFGLSISFLSAGTSSVNPPTCGDHCPWLRPAPTPVSQVNPPTCGDHCPWLR
jgi:hypothetical protein